MSPQVLHVPDIDFNVTCWTFLEYMHAIKNYTQGAAASVFGHLADLPTCPLEGSHSQQQCPPALRLV